MSKEFYADKTLYKQCYNNGVYVFSIYLIHKYLSERDTPAKNIPVRRFEHIYKWKIWGDYGIEDVIKDKKKYKKDYDIIMRCDLRYPIIVVECVLGNYIIMDGHHRLARAFIEKRKSIRSFVFKDPKLLQKFILFKSSADANKKINKLTKTKLDKIYGERFK